MDNNAARRQRINAYLLEKQSTEDVHYKQWTLGKLITMHRQKKLCNAPCNRQPRWDKTKQREFVKSVFEGKMVPPMYVNMVESNKLWHVYDGGNRLHALVSFFDGVLSVRMGEAPHHVFQKSAVDTEALSVIMGRVLHVFEWHYLPEHEACIRAENINRGTPMSIGERIRLVLGYATSRSIVLKEAYESEAFQRLRDIAGERYDGDLRFLAALVRHVLSGCSLRLGTNKRVPHTRELLTFFAANDEVVDEARVDQAHRIIEGIASALTGQTVTPRILFAVTMACIKEVPPGIILADDDIQNDSVDVDALVGKHLLSVYAARARGVAPSGTHDGGRGGRGGAA